MQCTAGWISDNYVGSLASLVFSFLWIVSCTVWVRNFYPLTCSEIYFLKTENFKRYFTYIFCIQIYSKLQRFIQLSLTLTRLCHIKCAHLQNLCVSPKVPLYRLHRKVWMHAFRPVVDILKFEHQICTFSRNIFTEFCWLFQKLYYPSNLCVLTIRFMSHSKSLCVVVDVSWNVRNIWWSRIIWHNFVVVRDGWMICSLAWIWTQNMHVKYCLKLFSFEK